MIGRRIYSGSPFEEMAGYARAVVDGNMVYVSGTTGFNPETMSFPGSVDSSFGAVGGAHITLQENPADVLGHLAALFLLQIQDRHLASGCRQRTGRTLAQPGSAACYNGRYIFEIHRSLPFSEFCLFKIGPENYFTFT